MSPRRTEAGAATLGAALLLMMLLTLAVLYAHRGLLFEQRSAANQYRAAQAFELAEGGIEWATAMLNDPRPVDASCSHAAAAGTFRDRYLVVDGDGELQVLAGGRPACRWSADGMSCACPAAGTTVDQPGDGLPRFGAWLEPVVGATDMIRLFSRGCVGGDASCIADAASGDTDAAAQAGIVLRWLPGLHAMPVAALTAGGSVQLGGDVTVVNRDTKRGGGLVHAAEHVTVAGSAVLAGPDGTPVNSLLHEHDATLAAAAVPVSLLGTTADAWGRRALVRSVAGRSAAERGAALLAGYAQGYRAFHVDGDLLLDVDVVGTNEEPLLLVSGHGVACARPCRLHGLVYGDVESRAATDLKNVSVQGAVVTRGHHLQVGPGGVEYDAAALERLRLLTGVFVRLPGSWRDF